MTPLYSNIIWLNYMGHVLTVLPFFRKWSKRIEKLLAKFRLFILFHNKFKQYSNSMIQRTFYVKNVIV